MIMCFMDGFLMLIFFLFSLQYRVQYLKKFLEILMIARMKNTSHSCASYNGEESRHQNSLDNFVKVQEFRLPNITQELSRLVKQASKSCESLKSPEIEAIAKTILKTEGSAVETCIRFRIILKKTLELMRATEASFSDSKKRRF